MQLSGEIRSLRYLRYPALNGDAVHPSRSSICSTVKIPARRKGGVRNRSREKKEEEKHKTGTGWTMNHDRTRNLLKRNVYIRLRFIRFLLLFYHKSKKGWTDNTRRPVFFFVFLFLSAARRPSLPFLSCLSIFIMIHLYHI